MRPPVSRGHGKVNAAAHFRNFHQRLRVFVFVWVPAAGAEMRLLRERRYALTELRPLALRRLMIRRPAFVAMRARNPCLLFRTLLLGWNVRFMSWPLQSLCSKADTCVRRFPETRVYLKKGSRSIGHLPRISPLLRNSFLNRRFISTLAISPCRRSLAGGGSANKLSRSGARRVNDMQMRT